MHLARRQKMNPYLCLISMKLTVCTFEYLNLNAEHMIQIDWKVPEIWSVKVKSREVRLFKQAHLFGKIRYVNWCNVCRETAKWRQWLASARTGLVIYSGCHTQDQAEWQYRRNKRLYSLPSEGPYSLLFMSTTGLWDFTWEIPGFVNVPWLETTPVCMPEVICFHVV